MADNKLIFKDAEEARDDITKRELKEIRKLYNQWARDIKSEYNSYKMSGGSDVQKMRELTQMYYRMRNASKQLSADINSRINIGINDMSNITVAVNKRWLSSLGIKDISKFDTRFSYAKNIAVRNIITGNLYSDKKPLSERIWNISQGHDRDIYNIISMGVAQDMSVYDIAKMLEKYVNPQARVPWTVKTYEQNGVTKIVSVHNRKVDYNAYRLARTMIQHSYQSTLIALTKDNPFVNGYIWHASGGHPCELCSDRDGTFYTAEEVPLDHPNGQCTLEVSIDEAKASGNLAEFYMNPIYYPEAFASGS